MDILVRRYPVLSLTQSQQKAAQTTKQSAPFSYSPEILLRQPAFQPGIGFRNQHRLLSGRNTRSHRSSGSGGFPGPSSARLPFHSPGRRHSPGPYANQESVLGNVTANHNCRSSLCSSLPDTIYFTPSTSSIAFSRELIYHSRAMSGSTTFISPACWKSQP